MRGFVGENERELISFDYAVKYLLRDKSDFVILSGFLSELLGRKVEVNAILENESRTNRVDLKAEIDGGEPAVFGIQFHRIIDFYDRMPNGVSKAIFEQVVSGSVHEIKKVYSVNIVYYNRIAKRDYLFCGKFWSCKGVHCKDEVIQFGVYDVPEVDNLPERYLILPNMFDGQLRGRFDEWVYILKRSAVRGDFTADGIEAASVRLDISRMSAVERKIHEKYLDNRTSLDNAVYTAEARGKAECEVGGKIDKKMVWAKIMIANGMDIDLVSKETGLHTDELTRLGGII